MADYNDLELIVLFDGDRAKFETAGDDGKIPKDVYKGRLVLITGNTTNTSNLAKKPQIYASDENGKGKYIPIPYSYVVGLKAGNGTLANIDKVIEFVGANGISVFVNENEKIQIDGGGIKDQAIEEISPLLASKADLEDGKIPVGQLPDAILGQMLFGGTITAGGENMMEVSPSSNLLYKVEMPSTTSSLTINKTEALKYEGAYFIVTGNLTSIFGFPVVVGDWIVSTGQDWRKVDNTDAIVKVAGVTPVNGDINASALAQQLAATGDANELALKSEVDKKYTKPSTGIPKNDLASEVQSSLAKADSAIVALGGDDYIEVKNVGATTTDKKITAKTAEITNETATTDGLATVADIRAYLAARLSVKVVS